MDLLSALPALHGTLDQKLVLFRNETKIDPVIFVPLYDPFHRLNSSTSARLNALAGGLAPVDLVCGEKDDDFDWMHH